MTIPSITRLTFPLILMISSIVEVRILARHPLPITGKMGRIHERPTDVPMLAMIGLLYIARMLRSYQKRYSNCRGYSVYVDVRQNMCKQLI